MALSDPQTLTIGGEAATLARTGSGDGSGTFTDESGILQLKVSHSNNGKRKRSVIRVNNLNVAPDYLNPATNVPISASFQLVIDRSTVGFTNADLKDILLGLTTWLSASSGANTAKILGGES